MTFLRKVRSLKNTLHTKTHEGLKTLAEFPAHNKVGLGLGVTSLGVSVAGYRANRARLDNAKEQLEAEKKSLEALQKIHEAISSKPLGKT